VTDTIAYGIALLATLVAVFAAWHTVRDAPFGNPLFYAVAALEVVLVVAMVGGFVALGRTDRDVSGGLYVSYWLTVAVIPPAAVLWGIAEKSRWGTGVVVVALLTVAALMLRLLGIWKGTYV
jgi:H+/gluconate symporter-like permease